MQQILEDLSRKRMNLTPSQISLFIKKVVNKRMSLMESFSCLPCSWYLYIFAKSVVAFIALQLESKTDSKSGQLDIFLYSTLTLIEWISLILLLVYAILKTESTLTESNNRLEDLSENVIFRNNSEAWMPVLNDICQADKFEYRVWDVFSIKYYVLLMCTVNFVELTNSLASTD